MTQSNGGSTAPVHRTLLTIVLTALISILAFFFTDRLAFGERAGEDRGSTQARLTQLEKQVDTKADAKELRAIQQQLDRIEEQLRETRGDIRRLERGRP